MQKIFSMKMVKKMYIFQQLILQLYRMLFTAEKYLDYC